MSLTWERTPSFQAPSDVGDTPTVRHPSQLNITYTGAITTSSSSIRGRVPQATTTSRSTLVIMISHPARSEKHVYVASQDLNHSGFNFWRSAGN
ncbi:hypothetical protein C8R44DRAFT_817192 [Mycena epipterygia]|nr:hypothetical protein C8R44DRAFT_817192 [Mycena epipterygia]